MSWIKRNAETVTAIGTAITALVAVLALAGVKLQIDATQQLHDTQAGKEIYREFLSLSIKNPELASLRTVQTSHQIVPFPMISLWNIFCSPQKKLFCLMKIWLFLLKIFF